MTASDPLNLKSSQIQIRSKAGWPMIYKYSHKKLCYQIFVREKID